MTIAARILALGLVVLALILLGADVVSSLQQGAVTVHSLAQLLALGRPQAVPAIHDWMAQRLPAPLAALVYGLLASWAWAVFGVAGVGIAFLAGRPRRAA